MTVSAETMKRFKDENMISSVNEAFFESQFKNYQILVKAKY